MNKNIFTVMFLVISLIIFSRINNSYGQTWNFIGGPPGVLNCNDIIFTDSDRIICSANEGILYSDDNGDNWYRANGYTSGNVKSFFRRLNGNLLAVSPQGLIKSYDNGSNWELIGSEGSDITESPADSSLYYTDGKTIFKSTDAVNWEPVWTGDTLGGITVTNSGWIYGGCRYGELILSKDNGKTFNRISIGYAEAYRGYDITNAICYNLRPNHHGGIYLLIHNPSFWSENVYMYQPSERNPLYFFPELSSPPAFASTGDGDLIFISDGAVQKFDFAKKETERIRGLHSGQIQSVSKIITEENKWLISFGTLGVIMSADSGKNWTEIGKGVKQCLSVHAGGRGELYTGAYSYAFWGGLYTSDNSGNSWENLNPLNYGSYFTGIERLNNGDIITSGSYGVFIYNGERWKHVDGINLAYPLYVSKKGIIYVGNNYNGIYISEDNGRTWRSSNTGISNSYFSGFGESGTGRIFAGGRPSGSYYSDNDGESWNYIDSPLLSNLSIKDFTFKEDTLFAASSGGLLISTDNGITWRYSGNLYRSINKIIVSPNGDILAAVENDGIYRSKNGGVSWEGFSEGLNNTNVRYFDFDNTNRLFIAADGGVFYTDEYSRGENSAADNFNLQQNFPNPFNSETEILFTIDKNSRVNLKVYDILGREITTLINGRLERGFYRFFWNASPYASGIYIISLQSGNDIKTIKCIHMK